MKTLVLYFQIIFFYSLLKAEQIYYLSIYAYLIDDRITKIYSNDINILPNIIDGIYNNPNEKLIIKQIDYNFGQVIKVEILNTLRQSYIGINMRINEYIIRPELLKFWNCENCDTDDGNYIYNNNKNYFSLNNNNSEYKYYYMDFNINSKEELTSLINIVDKNYYTLNQNLSSSNYLNLQDYSEFTLIDFTDKNNFYVTHDKSFIIPFNTIYFKLNIDESSSYFGKIMGFNFRTKTYEELKNNDDFQINDEYIDLKYIISERDLNNKGFHIKLNIITYNSPEQLELSQTVSNIGNFEFYFCQDGYKICDAEFYSNCINEFKCYEYCPKKISNSDIISTCNYCHPDCKTCSETFTETNKNCKSCSSPNHYLKYDYCVSSCDKGYYNDTEDSSNKICKCDLDNCFSCSIESLNNQNSCIKCNEEKGYYPLYENNDEEETFMKCYKFSEGYYLANSFYKKCYETCKYCSTGGDEIYHNCLNCKDDYIYEILYNNFKNCYTNCTYYFYNDTNLNQLYCTKTLKCEGIYNKLINGTRECIDECYKISQYKFRNICYVACPKDSIASENISFFCEVICYEEKPFELIEKQECTDDCSIKELKSKTCIIKYKDEKKGENENININNTDTSEKNIAAQDVILDSINNGITSEKYDTSDIENGEDDIIEDKKMTITITTTENQKNNNNDNYTKIDLGECETLLRKAYKIPEDKKIYMKIVDVPQEGMKISKIEYEIYCKLNDKNLIQLNKTACENSKVDLVVHATLSENIDKLNSSSGYYNDICYTATSDDGTDILLKDRKNEFIKYNKTLCQDNCEFTEYDYKKNKAKCSCEVKESSSFFDDIVIDKEKLFDSFINVKNIGNFNLMICYKSLFSKKGILKNIGFYILIIIILFHTICVLLFYRKYFGFILDKIEKILFAIKNWDLVREEERERKRIEIMKFKNKKKLIKKIIKKVSKKQDKIILPSPFDFYFQTKNDVFKYKTQNNPPIKNNKFTINNSSINKNLNSNKSKITNENMTKKKFNYKFNNKKEILEKTKEIMKLNDEELNNLSFNLALKYDKRTYWQYYFSLVKTKHVLVFTFCNNNDYNSKIIKIDLFFIGFAIFFTVNAFFFNDETMHKIYEEKGSFNLIYQLPQIIYSSLISLVLNTLLNLLALSQDEILKLKKDKNKNNINKRKKNINDNLRIRFLIYFVLGFIFLIFFWYYLSIFCAIYINTQIHLIKDTLISFSLSFFSPLIIFIFPGIFRIPSLSNSRSKKNVYIILVSFFK